MHGDFYSDEKMHYLHISGRVIHNLDGNYVFTLLFLDDTQHTQLRRSYEYMFRLASHELKSPLACIIGSAECAEDHIRAGSIVGLKTCLDMIERNAWAMEEMIQRYLNLSRIESGEIVPRPGDMRLSDDVLNPLMIEFKAILQSKAMTLAYEFPQGDHEPHVYADAELVTIVVRNLVSNAMKYGNAGSVIGVELRAGDEGVEVAVENEGPNIPELQLRKLFQKFVRLEATQGSKGAGLGLYNARKLVELWGGSIRAESGKGKTRFVFTIPEG
jgi:signal transduction histidine kinase